MKNFALYLALALILLSGFQAEGATSVIRYTTSNNAKISPQGTFANSAGTALSPSSAYSNGSGTLTFPQDIKTISSYAFHNCPKLTSVTLPDCVTSVGYFAFSTCTSLQSPVCNAQIFARLNTSYKGAYSISEGISRISSAAFYKCTSLSAVTIPGSVTAIEECAFAGCTGLAAIYVAEVPAAVESNSFNNVNKKTCVLYVPKGCVDTYRTAAVWKDFTNIIEIVVEEPDPDEDEEQPSDNPEDNGDNPGEGTGDNTGEGTGDNPGEGAGDNTGEGAGDNPGEGAGDNTQGGNEGDNPEVPTYTDVYKLEYYPKLINSFTPVLLTNGRPVKKIEFDVTNLSSTSVIPDTEGKAAYGVVVTKETTTTGSYYHVVATPSEVIPVGTEVELFKVKFYCPSKTRNDVAKVSFKNVKVTDQDGVEHAVNNYTSNVYYSTEAKVKTTNDGEAPYHGNYSAPGAFDLMNKSLPDDALIIDITSVTKLTEGVVLTPPNPNAMIYANSWIHLGNTQNVVTEDSCRNFALTDGYAYKLVRTTFAEEASYTRLMNSEWGTLCLPFDVESNADVKYYEIASYNGSAESSSIWLTPLSVLPAGTPGVCRRLCSDQNVTMRAVGVDVLASFATEAVSTQEGLVLHGTSRSITINPSSAAAGNSAYYIASNCFWQVTGDVTVSAYRCWFEIASGANQAPFRLALDDESTGLESIECVGVRTNQIYDMQGLPHAEPVNGLQIMNGCKVLLRE